MHIKRLEELLQPNPALLAELPKPVLQRAHHSVRALSLTEGEREQARGGASTGQSPDTESGTMVDRALTRALKDRRGAKGFSVGKEEQEPPPDVVYAKKLVYAVHVAKQVGHNEREWNVVHRMDVYRARQGRQRRLGMLIQ